MENLTGDDVDDDNENAIDNDNDDLNIDDAGKLGTEGEDGLRLGERGTRKGGTSRQQRSGQESKNGGDKEILEELLYHELFEGGAA